LQALRRQVRRDRLVECRKHKAAAVLTSIPYLGLIRAALLLARVQTPFRLRGKRQFWAYCGLALETRTSADHSVLNRAALMVAPGSCAGSAIRHGLAGQPSSQISFSSPLLSLPDPESAAPQFS